MPLQNLPVEILDNILRLVGSDSLRKHEACCLPVSKWWYELAEPILLEELVLSAHQLKRIPENTIIKLQKSLRRLQIHIKPLPERQVDEELINSLNNVLPRLLPKAARLQQFDFIANGYFNPDKPLVSYKNYLGPWPLMNLVDILPFYILSDLTIDTMGSGVKTGEHICPRIASRIPSLRSIKLRMRCICLQVLEFDHHSKIEKIIINLSLKENNLLEAGFSHHCTEQIHAYDLNDAMVAAATNIATKIPSIKMLRIMSHTHPGFETVTTDCINGSRMILSGDWK
ncbi:uncharacterized protein N7483_013048 [Penicillium malachiteum]|uniref:uncharacterized protein n=1 Tax=Penicillium malachiteum TaxID=1324776 RepID=UPI00254924BE|nr:uncharacterized protein N7483_013048 [Penicillium malachiteum]KAJ5715867.1 hypothetical protein N7483_013048 [Penicillium malachiteum]